MHVEREQGEACAGWRVFPGLLDAWALACVAASRSMHGRQCVRMPQMAWVRLGVSSCVRPGCTVRQERRVFFG